MKENTSGKHSWVRELFWPIYGEENWKFVPMLAMMVLALFIYTTLRIHKDTYILSSPLSSANTTSFLKAYLVLPISIIYMMFFCSLINKTSKEKLFFLGLLPFFLFFLLFFLVFLPNADLFHMSVKTIELYQKRFPSMKNFIPVLAYWSFSLYYVFSELWGTVVISFLFWGFANCVVTPNQSKRFYAFFASYSYIGLICAAKIQSYVYKVSSLYPKGSKEYLNILFINFYFVFGSMILFLFLYWFMNNRVLPFDKDFGTQNIKITVKKNMSLSESLYTIINSKYLMSIAIIVICYGLTSNLIEVTWKELVRQELNGVESAIGEYMSEFYFTTGICTIFCGLINKHITARFGWLTSSLFTPIILLVLSISFFVLIIFDGCIPSRLLFGYSSGFLAMQLGFFQDIIAKGCKYGVMDPNIQMAYMPLDEELKIKGKAAVDIVGVKFGKSLGSFLESNLSILYNGADQLALAPIFVPIIIGCNFLWIFFTISLAFVYEELLRIKKR